MKTQVTVEMMVESIMACFLLYPFLLNCYSSVVYLCHHPCSSQTPELEENLNVTMVAK